MRFPLHLTATLVLALVATAHAADDSLRDRAAQGLRRACDFFQNEVSCEGGYLWRYSEDLQKREGEGKAAATVVWVQPPGTPSVGMAMLGAYEATKDRYYLEAARRAGDCLIRGQLRSGGWDYSIDFDPKQRGRYNYRVDPFEEAKSRRNVSTLDDDTTQSALRFLMGLDRALDFKDERIHEAVVYGLGCLLKAQYPNGAWPQRFQEPPDPAAFPVKRASYPDQWSRKYSATSYSSYYTFNDNTIGDTIDMMFLAWRTYRDDRYRTSAERAGDFILLAQMPEPQPAWAQQYDAAMHPAWARKFEPPAVTGGESQGIISTLLKVYRETGDGKYLEPIPRAIAYLRRSILPDGTLARFYELRTNQPLYFTKDYQLTDSDADMPTHYAFKVPNSLGTLEREYRELAELDSQKPHTLKPEGRQTASPKWIAQVEKVLGSQDDRGRWVQDGSLHYQGEGDRTNRIIECDRFIHNIGVLSQYLASGAD